MANDSKKENAQQRVFFVQSFLKEHGIDAVVLYNSDPHSSENLAPHYAQIAFLSGFEAESATMVVTCEGAFLWTDSRYFIQATSDLEGTGITLMKIGVEGVPSIPAFVKGLRVAIDPITTSISDAEDLKACASDLVLLPDFIGRFWKSAASCSVAGADGCEATCGAELRPAFPCEPLEVLDVEYAGLSHTEKLALVRSAMTAPAMLVTALDEIAWTLNIRSTDIAYDPFAFGYLLVTYDTAVLYMNKDVPAGTLEGVQVEPYAAIYEDLPMFDCSLQLDPSTTNYYIYSILQGAASGDPQCAAACTLHLTQSPIQLMKAVKNPTEIAHLRNAYFQDGLALTKFLYYLDTTTDVLDEWALSQKLDSFRAQIDGYKGNSFETISAYGPSAALPHYHTSHVGSRLLERRGLYLVDSGGQYLFGTTDVTRTVPLGPLTEEEKLDYTLVLKGMIDLSMAVFPRGTAGCQIDALAREPLWAAMRNFGHGTGHGIGFYLACHEGPQGIRQNFNPQPMLPGMVTSNEPSLYREGLYGIRHENILLCVEKGTSQFGTFYGFETLTLAPIDPRPVCFDLLTTAEREWLTAYNAHVYDVLAPHLPSEVSAWLRNLIAE